VKQLLLALAAQEKPEATGVAVMAEIVLLVVMPRVMAALAELEMDQKQYQ
jgi:hypothetical protein